MNSNTKQNYVPTKLAAIQMVSGDELQHNLCEAQRLINDACAQGAKLIVLPENFAVFGMSSQAEVGQEEAGKARPIRKFLSLMAKENCVWIVGGTIPICDNTHDNRPLSSCLLIDDQGNELARYNKIHLFDVLVKDNQGSYHESKTYQPGSEIVTAATSLGKLGLAVCYDLRFPELFRIMFQRGIDLLVLPAAFTKATGAAHWLTLLRARAIENCCFVVAANQGGIHSNKRETFGHSVIISPWGEILSCVDTGPGVACAEMDISLLTSQRENIPVAQHQRFYVEDTEPKNRQ